jgi:hypothetical protein
MIRPCTRSTLRRICSWGCRDCARAVLLSALGAFAAAAGARERPPRADDEQREECERVDDDHRYSGDGGRTVVGRRRWKDGGRADGGGDPLRW